MILELHQAIQTGTGEKAKGSASYIDWKDTDGRTALHYAARLKNPYVVQCLTDQFWTIISCYSEGKDAQTPLDYVVDTVIKATKSPLSQSWSLDYYALKDAYRRLPLKYRKHFLKKYGKRLGRAIFRPGPRRAGRNRRRGSPALPRNDDDVLFEGGDVNWPQ